MTELLKGLETAEQLDNDTRKISARCIAQGVTPTLAVVRIGDRPSDVAYEQSLIGKAGKVGIDVVTYVLDRKADLKEVKDGVRKAAEDQGIDAILIMRPLPGNIDSRAVYALVPPSKDVDGVTLTSEAGLVSGRPIGFLPCTAQAVMELLKHEKISLSGKKVVIVGRSPVVGLPLALLFMRADATVTVCHSRTVNLPAETRTADILVSCTGQAGMITKEHVREGQILIDIGMSRDADGELVGDASAEEVDGIVDRRTPVKGGVGIVTTSVLMRHVALAGARSAGVLYEKK